jgi:Rhodopirellula transposase DDE domain
MEKLTEALKTVLTETAKTLTGAVRRLFMARTVRMFGRGGAQRAEEDLGWNRGTLRKGRHELESSLRCVDNFSARGRDRAEEHWPNLEQDLREIVKPQSQIDPSFKTQRLYTRLSAAEVRHQLVVQKGYAETDVPTRRTVSTKLNAFGFHLRKVAKSKPKKKVPETDAIFEEVHRENTVADAADDTLRISLDAKAVVKIGESSRAGDSRVPVAAADHDFKPDATVTPFGFLLPHSGALFLYLGTSKITSDFIVDSLEDLWQTTLHPNFPLVCILVLNLDNGPENQSRRTQFIKRLVDFVARHQVTVRLAYYPPYHSKYNPIEHCWGSLEQHWNGTLLDELETVVNFAESMLWKGMHPVVKVVTKIYETGVSLTQAAMAGLETQIKRLPSLEKWFVEISPATLVSDG